MTKMSDKTRKMRLYTEHNKLDYIIDKLSQLTNQLNDVKTRLSIIEIYTNKQSPCHHINFLPQLNLD